MFDDLHFRSTQVVLIAQPSCIFISVFNNRSWIAIDLDATDVFGLVRNMAEENRCEVRIKFESQGALRVVQTKLTVLVDEHSNRNA